MFPLLLEEEPNPLHLFQIWLNLPAKSKMVDPYFSMYWKDDVPTVMFNGDSVSVTAIAGNLEGITAVSPPPDSWASNPASDIAVWHIKMDPNSTWTLPPGTAAANRVLYFFRGSSIQVAEEDIPSDTGVELKSDQPVVVSTGSQACEMMLLHGTPLDEPVAQYGPFVMNSTAEVQQAIRDYQTTQFGGWPWTTNDPTHGSAKRRFAETNPL